MTEELTLELCPWCRKYPNLDVAKPLPGTNRQHDIYMVVCSGWPDCPTRPHTRWYDVKDEAISAWNNGLRDEQTQCKHEWRLSIEQRGDWPGDETTVDVECRLCHATGDDDDLNAQTDALRRDLAAMQKEADDERDKRIQWGRNRQDALDRVRWVESDLAAANQRVAELEAGLRWYADPENYRTTNAAGEFWLCPCNAMNDNGDRARRTLGDR